MGIMFPNLNNSRRECKQIIYFNINFFLENEADQLLDNIDVKKDKFMTPNI
jgi:hypothetical protein